METQSNGHYGWTEDHELSGGKLGEKKIACVRKVSGQSEKGRHVFRVKKQGCHFLNSYKSLQNNVKGLVLLIL